MAHELDLTNDRANMAYVGEVPWHGLGKELTADSDLDTWRVEAGMEWNLERSPVIYTAQDGLRAMAGRSILFRSDNQAALSVVSDGYRIVQPGEVLEFYRDLTKAAGFQLETAGVLFGGRKFWALAKCGKDATIRGQDVIKPYLLLATSCDGSLATSAQFTSVRVVCQNTLTMSIGASGARADIRVPHSRVFDPAAVKAELGIGVETWESFLANIDRLVKTNVDRDTAIQTFADILKMKTVDEETGEEIDLEEAKGVIQDLLTLWDGAAKGHDLRSSKNTAWGLVNCVTEFADHHRATRTIDSRIDRAWFGDGALMKNRAMEAALKLAA